MSIAMIAVGLANMGCLLGFRRNYFKYNDTDLFNDYIILGDLNHYEADDILGIKRNNYKSTYEDIILDYILPIQCNDIDIDVNVNNIDIRNMTDHQPVEGVLIQKSQQPESNR